MLDPERRKLLETLYRELAAYEALYLTQKIVTFRANPQSRGQKEFFEDSRAIIRLVLGDNRSGKSVCGAVEAVAHSYGYRPWLPEDHPDRIVRMPNGESIPVPNVGRVLAQDYAQAVKQNIWAKIREWAPRGQYKIKKDNRGIPVEVNWTNGSVWYLMSNDQDDMVFEGTNGHWFWVDEPCDYRKYVALKRGLVDFGGHCWLTLTPLSQPWIADIIESRANDPDGEVKVYEFSIYENDREHGGFLDRKAIEGFVADLRPEEKEARIGHQWAHLTGRIFKEWFAQPPFWIEPFNIPSTWPRICVIDPHPRKPVAVLWAALNPDNQLYVYRELFDENLVTIADVSARIKYLEGSEPIAMRLIDSFSHMQDRISGSNVRRKFADEGIWALPAAKSNIAAGLDSIHAALQVRRDWEEPGLVVFNTCTNVKSNFLRHVWDSWKSSRDRDIKGERQEVRKTDDDFIACLRYIYQAKITYDMLKRELRNQVEDDPLEGFSGPSIFTGDMDYDRCDGSERERSPAFN